MRLAQRQHMGAQHAEERGQRSELLGIDPLVGPIVAAFGMLVAVGVALAVAFGAIARGGRPAAREEELP